MAETIKISLNELPNNSSEPASVNFGPGADLLMNPNKQKKESMAASDIVLDDLTELNTISLEEYCRVVQARKRELMDYISSKTEKL